MGLDHIAVMVNTFVYRTNVAMVPITSMVIVNTNALPGSGMGLDHIAAMVNANALPGFTLRHRLNP
jgi:hypothetical protein